KLLRRQKDLAGAITHYRKVVELAPRSASARCDLGLALYDRKDLDGAITEFRTATQLDSNYPHASGALGLALLEKGQFAEARPLLQRFVKLVAAIRPARQLGEKHLQQCDHLLRLEHRLATLQETRETPRDIKEALELVDLCRRYKGYHVAAARLYEG